MTITLSDVSLMNLDAKFYLSCRYCRKIVKNKSLKGQFAHIKEKHPDKINELEYPKYESRRKEK